MHWIDIKENPPPNGIDVLVLKDHGEHRFCGVEHLSSEGKFLCYGGPLITHWAYLPPFPNLEREEVNRFEIMDL